MYLYLFMPEALRQLLTWRTLLRAIRGIATELAWRHAGTRELPLPMIRFENSPVSGGPAVAVKQPPNRNHPTRAEKVKFLLGGAR
jgi:hypothetical protein